jgi:signal transduction histidine kinase
MLRALANLTDNAVDFSSSGGTVAIAVTVPESSPSLIEIAVRDRGTGIRAESLEHVFEPFFTTRERGTGLGLANVRKIVECHGGTVRASNRSEGGAVFTVRIPAVKEKL